MNNVTQISQVAELDLKPRPYHDKSHSLLERVWLYLIEFPGSTSDEISKGVGNLHASVSSSMFTLIQRNWATRERFSYTNSSGRLCSTYKNYALGKEFKPVKTKEPAPAVIQAPAQAPEIKKTQDVKSSNVDDLFDMVIGDLKVSEIKQFANRVNRFVDAMGAAVAG